MPIADSLFVLSILSLVVVVSEWLVRKTILRYFGTALLVILVTALVANIGIIPAGSTPELPVPVYEGIFAYLAPISIFWLLLAVNLKDILKSGLSLIGLYLIGAMGTTLGVIIGMLVINGAVTIGENYAPLGGMFVGTYIGGSVNFNAIALNYDLVRNGILYAGSVSVDNIITALWMMVTLALPKLLAPFWPGMKADEAKLKEVDLGIEADTEAIHPMDLGITLSFGFGALFVSNLITESLKSWQIQFPSIITLTLLALIIAQLPIRRYIKGAQTLGMFAVYVFLATIGAFCNLEKLGELGTLGVYLFIFALIIVVVHGLFVVAGAWLLKLDPETAAVASQANIGGSTSALALARSLGRNDLVLPAVLLGSLGLALGTFLGFLAAEKLLPYLF